jgi:threonine dehydrogenase-like Zn-dependent dehydrogenase
MKGLVYCGPRDIRYEAIPDPILQEERDIIVKMEACAICGSDLHIFHGEGFSQLNNYSVGHEAVGEVVEAGRGVYQRRIGDKVMLPGAVGCGACENCLSGLTRHCLNNRQQVYGLGHGLGGCQAEAIRVPAGDFNAVPIPDGVTTEQALMLTDSLATAWFGCRLADVSAGASVAVIGLGPIGLMAVECALVLGAARVFAVDPVEYRRKIASELGAIPLDSVGAVDEVREATNGRMVDCAIEIVGIEQTIALALALARARGTVSSVGGGRLESISFPQKAVYRKGLTFRTGSCSTPYYYRELIPLVQLGRLHPERFITHHFNLSQGDEAYRAFDQRLGGVLKTVMLP